MIQPERIGFDFDGVVADTMEAFIRLADEDYAIKVSPLEITDFMVEECLDIDQEIVDEIFARLVQDPLGVRLRPMPGAIAVLEELAENAPLTFITARPDGEPVAEWLDCYLSNKTFAELRLIATGDHDGKVDHIREMGLTHFVDDRADTGNLLAREKGITPIIYDQPWNLGQHALDSVDNWQAIKRMCGA
ncbi:MAG: hypothetical protein ABFS18_11895 [Thermodesulfobacteriota bacterium]